MQSLAADESHVARVLQQKPMPSGNLPGGQGLPNGCGVQSSLSSGQIHSLILALQTQFRPRRSPVHCCCGVGVGVGVAVGVGVGVGLAEHSPAISFWYWHVDEGFPT